MQARHCLCKHNVISSYYEGAYKALSCQLNGWGCSLFIVCLKNQSTLVEMEIMLYLKVRIMAAKCSKR